ncbi:MAG: single-stranded-DNA-specific exonuclease RecJ [Parcubacteria group bacterium]|nr:single-stranded-DNA-specific exonuclease RecJ [Parcubacteria group bacterium]
MPERALNIHPVVDALLSARGITEAARDLFLHPDYERDTHDPFLMPDMERAVERILRAMERNERIAVYTDFDCDGIPAAVIAHDTLQKIGFENFEVYIPHRHNEGYGFHVRAIDELAARGVSLIITADVGTVAHVSVAHAQSIGVDVIVTDHHELGETLPPAYAVINPKRAGYPFPDLCGAATLFKLMYALLIRMREQDAAFAERVPVGWEKWLLDMVGIATVADMVPLVEENRVLARFGLMVLRKSPRPGIQAFCRKLRLDQSRITEDDIGFSIAPRINAASRMDKPELAFRLLATKDVREAEALAGELERLNSQRKGTVASLVKEAKHIARERFADAPCAVLGNPDWKPALLGLAANVLMEERGGVVCLWGRDGNGALKGSCRSDGTVNIIDMFRAAHVESALEEAGGHAMAGGFSVSFEQVHHLPDIFTRAVESARVSVDARSAAHDAELAPEDVGRQLFDALSSLRPFGMGNPKPVFRIPALTVESVRIFGKEQSHTEITARGDRALLRAFDFFRTPDEFTVAPRVGARIDALATIERDLFRNSITLRLVDIVSA